MNGTICRIPDSGQKASHRLTINVSLLILGFLSEIWAAPVKIGMLQPWGNSKEDPWSSSYNPANVRPKVLANVNKTLNLLTKAGQAGCDIVCTPEDIAGLAGYGYYPYNELPGQWDPIVTSLIDTVPNTITNQISTIAATYSMYIVAGMYVKESDGHYYNCALFFNRSGILAGKYRKVHLPAFEEWGLKPGNTFPIFTTDFGKVGAMICYDISFPEASLAYGLSGVNLIVYPTMAMEYWGGGNSLENAIPLRMRAYDSNIYIASSNYGHGAGLIGPSGQVLAEAPGVNDTVIIKDVDLSVEPKDGSSWWNAIWGTDLVRARQVLKRNPSAYSLLTSSSSPIVDRYAGINIITGQDTLAMAAAVQTINYSNHPYFTSSNTIEVRPGQFVDYRVLYGNPTGAAVSLTYLLTPAWTTAVGNTISGTAPLTARTDTARVLLSAYAFKETLTVRIFVTGTPGISLAKVPSSSKYLTVVPTAFGDGNITFTIAAQRSGDLSLSVLDIHGRKIWGYDRKAADQGLHSILWNGVPSTRRSGAAKRSTVSNGQYILYVKQNSETIAQKLSIMN